MELLAPIKDKNSAILAINLGVEAIYCSGPFYSARQNAGISMEDLKFIIEYAHVYNTKVYITLNTLIFQENFKDVLKYIDELVLIKIDALIIQDLGLLDTISRVYPDLELHASTQMHVHNIAGVRFIQKHNFKRVVLPRETSIESIKEIKSITGIDIETFIHGALCTSYSGQCYYSAFYHNGSGNLGSCTQNCRKKHGFNPEPDKTMLSLKDLAVERKLVNLIGISDSFKIEGRLKSLEYIYSTIKYYQDVLKGFNNEKMADLMQIAFNRQYTKGFLFNDKIKNIQNHDRINNHGLYVGDVVSSNNKYIEIKLVKPLNRLDNIRIVAPNSETGMTVDKIYVSNIEVEYVEGGIIKILNNQQTPMQGRVYIVKTRAYEKIISDSQKKYLNKIQLKAQLKAKINQPLIIKINETLYKSDFIVEKAKNQGMDDISLVKQLSKTKDTPFEFSFESIDVEDNIFIVKSQLNEFRRTIIENEYQKTVKRRKLDRHEISLVELNSETFSDYKYMIRTIDQAEVLNKCGIDKVYVDNIKILNEVRKMFKQVIPVLPRIIKQRNFDFYLEQVKDYDSVMVSELGMLEKLNKKNIEANYSLNIANATALNLLKNNSVSNAVLSIEVADRKLFNVEGIDSTFFAYGYIPLMIMDYCPLNENKEFTCNKCTICQDKQHYLYNDNNDKLPLVHYGIDNLELLSDKPINKLKNKTNCKYKLISLTIENKEETERLLRKLIRKTDL